jgi:hypothetical protein
MTIEQLKKANEIRFKLDKLDYFERMFISNSTVWLVTEKKELYLKDYPDLAVLIQNYISDKIVELKIELEEL